MPGWSRSAWSRSVARRVTATGSSWRSRSPNSRPPKSLRLRSVAAGSTETYGGRSAPRHRTSAVLTKGDRVSDATRAVLTEVHAERLLQDDKWGEQNHPNYIHDTVPWVQRVYAAEAAKWKIVN